MGIDNWSDVAQLGAVAVMAFMLLATIRELLPRLLTIISQNAEAMERMAAALQSNTTALERVSSALAGIDVRLARLEEQHSRNGRQEARG